MARWTPVTLKGCILPAVLVLTGCSSIIEGTSQEIMVNTNPAGADCSLNRQGLSIAHVNPTPGAATIKKTKYDITIVCNKPGFEEATYLNHSGVAGATFGNIVLGGGIGWAIDSAAGADNKYESPVNITLVRQDSDAPAKHATKVKKQGSSAPTDTSAATSPNDNNATEDGDKKTSDDNDWPSSKR